MAENALIDTALLMYVPISVTRLTVDAEERVTVSRICCVPGCSDESARRGCNRVGRAFLPIQTEIDPRTQTKAASAPLCEGLGGLLPG